ncbi:MAG: GHKL domain-containing protein [Clostridia bacterium]|nr:GHKL domain-containing protein [Clostridia bacterium]
MNFLFIPLFSALHICFLHLLFRRLLEPRFHGIEYFSLLVFAWLITSVFGFFDFPGLYSYFVFLLMATLLLLFAYGENGSHGFWLLTVALGVPFITDKAFSIFAADYEGMAYYLILAAGKALPCALVLILSATEFIGRNRTKADIDALLLKQHMELQKESMNALEQNYRLQRKSTHEFEHHLQVLGDLLRHNETDAACDYLDKLKKNRSMHIMGVNSRHPVVDVILNQKYQLAQESEILVQVQVNDLSGIDIPSDSLVVVLTNLWDNAIEACRRVDGYREIICSILDDEGLYISIRNTSNPVRIENGRIATSKTDPLSHGFGLMSVCNTLDNLGAEYSYDYDEGWFSFVAEIEK